MTALRIRNDSTDRALLVHIWYATNPLASDGDNRWLDEKGQSAPSGSRIECLSPGKLIELDAARVLSLTLSPQGTEGVAALFERLMGVFGADVARGRPSRGTAAVPFTIACVNAQAALRVRVFAGSAFQFVPLREESIRTGEAVQLSTGVDGISLKIG